MSKSQKILSDSELEKKYYGSGLASRITVMPEESLWLPSRNLYLNYTMGGGIPYGKICEVFGGESSGKSLLAMDFGYAAQYLGGVLLWNDAEQSFDPGWAKANGLNLDKTIVYNETSIELISDWAADMALTWRNKLRANEPIVIVTDSIAALDCEANINSSQVDSKAEMGNRAKALYRYVRTRNQHFADLGIIAIFINQLRKKVGATMFEDPDCMFSDTIIPLVDGRALPIGKIVREKIQANVWSYNEEFGIFEPKPIIGWVKKEKLQPGEKWIQIKTNGPGNKNGIFGGIFTEKHGLLTPHGWRNVNQLKVGDMLLTKYPSIVNKEFRLTNQVSHKSLPIEITHIGEASKKAYRKPYKYDLVIADNHNFLAGGKDNGFIAHNTTPGGEAMKFFAHQRMAFFRKKQIAEGNKDNKVWIGNEVSVRLKKNKVAPPRPSFTTNVFFNAEYGKVGFEKYTNLVQLLEKTGVVERKKGASHYYYRGEVLANGQDNFQAMLEEDKDLRAKLIRRAKVNTLTQTHKKLEKLQDQGINRYPV